MRDKIKTWWLNRLLLAWIPLLFLCYSAISVYVANFHSAIVNFAIAVVIFLIFEQFLFSYKVALSSEKLLYSYGFLWRRSVEIDARDIRSFEFLPVIGLPKLQSARVLVQAGNERFMLSLASFRAADVRRVAAWLSAHVRPGEVAAPNVWAARN